MIDFGTGYELNREIDFSQMVALEKALLAVGVPCERRRLYDGWQICYPSIENRVADVICHYGSYGAYDGLLEIWGLVSDDNEDTVEGYLNAGECFNLIWRHYAANR